MNDFIVIIIYSVDKSQVFYSALSLSTIAKAVTSLALVLLIGGLLFSTSGVWIHAASPPLAKPLLLKGLERRPNMDTGAYRYYKLFTHSNGCRFRSCQPQYRLRRSWR